MWPVSLSTLSLFLGVVNSLVIRSGNDRSGIDLSHCPTLPVITIGSQPVTLHASGFVAGTATITPGTKTVTVSGTPLSLGPSGVLHYGAQVITIPTAIPTECGRSAPKSPHSARNLVPRDGSDLWKNYKSKGDTRWNDLAAALKNDDHQDADCLSDMEENFEIDSGKVTEPARSLQGIFKGLDIGIDAKYYPISAIWPKDDSEPTAAAMFDNVFCPAYGVITADINNRILSVNPADPKPPNWSRAVWALWLATNQSEVKAGRKSNVSGLKYVFRQNITNDDTMGLMDEAFGSDDKTKPKTFKPNEEAFRALLGSPNGSGVAFLLQENKNALQSKTFKSVTIQAVKIGNKLEHHMWFELEKYNG